MSSLKEFLKSGPLTLQSYIETSTGEVEVTCIGSLQGVMRFDSKGFVLQESCVDESHQNLFSDLANALRSNLHAFVDNSLHVWNDSGNLACCLGTASYDAAVSKAKFVDGENIDGTDDMLMNTLIFLNFA